MSSVVESYCRDIEAYLCRKNDGHLIRVTGPAFERVTRWAEQGIPLAVACEGIDRYFERQSRKGPRRRPVRIEFCEADVLDAFDAWRRAVGVTLEPDAGAARARSSLATHMERAIARLTSLRASRHALEALGDVLERVTRELDRLQPQARTARGHAREALLESLVVLDGELMQAAMRAVDDQGRLDAMRDAAAQLAPFRERMTAEAYDRACTAAMERHVRERFNLPTLTFA
ncbi:MAG TPA: hypothetical protein VMO26_22605 [Vicinamibacterales bacterium]|nr:hypothetical protein [Vicinamibacterales bacterium]